MHPQIVGQTPSDNLPGQQNSAPAQNDPQATQGCHPDYHTEPHATAAPAAQQRSTFACMQAAKRWLVWDSNKVPFYPNGSRRSGTLDSQTDWDNLGTYDEARGAYLLSNGDFEGIGFALGPDGSGNCWQGIDFDKIVQNQLQDLANNSPGYTELSPSGLGMHAIGYGRHFETLGSNGTGVEAYAENRYFTVPEVESYDKELICLANYVEMRIAPAHGKKNFEVSIGDKFSRSATVLPATTVTELRSALNYIPADGYELWISVGQALRELGEVGRGLWIDWSQTSEKYKPHDAKKWKTFDGQRTGYQAVFKKAQDLGWPNPNSNAARVNAGAGIGAARGFQDQAKFRLISEEEIAARPPVRWRVRGVVPDEGVVAIYGPPGSGKSFLALDMLAAIANGCDWFGNKVRAAPVTYVALEGKAGVSQRVKAYRAKKRAIGDIRFIDSPMDLRNAADRAGLVDAITEAGWDKGVLCVDTLAASSPGMDENASADMGALIAGLQEIQEAIGGCVIVVHHTGKDRDKGLRGWSGLNGALDASIEVWRNDQKREWKVAKAKDGEDGKTTPFRLEIVQVDTDEDGEAITSCVITSDLPMGQPAAQTDAVRDEEDNEFIWQWIDDDVKKGKFPSKNSLRNSINEMKEQQPTITRARIAGAIDRLMACSRVHSAPTRSPSGNTWLRAVASTPLTEG